MNLQNIKTGDKVFRYMYSGQKIPDVKEITHSTANFIQIGSAKYRRVDGKEVGSTYSGDRIRAIEAGEVEKYEKQKADYTRIENILQLLKSKGFTFTGYHEWYSIAEWEKLAKVFGSEII